MANLILYTSKLVGQEKEIGEIKEIFDTINTEQTHKLIEVNIDEDEHVYAGYIGKTPVLEIGPYHLFSPFTKQDMVMTIGATMDRQKYLEEQNDMDFINRKKRGGTITKSDRFSLWLTKHYMIIFNLLLLVFIGLPVLAPVLSKNGATFPAAIIHKIYSPLCHQLGYRSWFLFGEQAAYPREIAGEEGISFEEATGISSTDVIAAKNFIGNERLGYKVAICQRDTAIYGGILIFGILFSITGRRMKPIRWYIWVILGILPMGIDGVSQLPSLLVNNLPWLPIRESTPLLRTITGLLFGVTTAWYGYPLIEETMRDSRKVLIKKFSVNEIK